MWVVRFTPRPLYPQGKSPWYSLDKRLGGLYSFHIQFNVISHLWLRSPRCLLQSGLQTAISHTLLINSTRSTCPNNAILLDLTTLIIYVERVQIMKLLIIQISASSHKFLRHPIKCCPQHIFLRCPQAVFFIYGEKLRFTPIQNNM